MEQRQQQRDDILYAYDSAKAEVQKAKAALKNAELNYGYTTIKAPIDGVVGLSSRDIGAYIETQNSKLTIVTALDSVYAEFSIPSSDASKYVSQIKAGAKVTLSRGIKTYDGEVDFIAPKLDLQTDTLLLRAKFKNSDRDLIIGSYVEVSLGGFSYESVAKIPQIALVKTSDATIVYIIENGAVSMRPVKVSHVEDGMAFIGDGLKDGEHIAISNMAKLKPNSKVTVGDGK
ncbi:MAG: efflux RND transporter periplasmic adaptor subunit [Campylobacterota bacterium]